MLTKYFPSGENWQSWFVCLNNSEKFIVALTVCYMLKVWLKFLEFETKFIVYKQVGTCEFVSFGKIIVMKLSRTKVHSRGQESTVIVH